MKKAKVVEMTQAVDAEIAVDDALQDMNADLAKEFQEPRAVDYQDAFPQDVHRKLASQIDEAANDIQERLIALDQKREEAMDRLKTAMAEVSAIDAERTALARIKLQNTMWRMAGKEPDIPPGEGLV